MASETLPTSPAPRPHHGKADFVWHDLMTPDLEGSLRFYGGLFGWTIRTDDTGERPYYHLSNQGRDIGGMLAHDPAHGPAFWMGYVDVADVDAAVACATELGGKLALAPRDIPGVGRFAVLADREGANFVPFQLLVRADEGMPGPGDFSWDSLYATDPDAAAAFYGQVIGWERQSFGPSASVFVKDGSQEASLYRAPSGMPAYWLTHVAVADFEGARTKASELGAKILEPRVDVPGIGSYCVIQDPAGAVLSLFGNPAS